MPSLRSPLAHLLAQCRSRGISLSRIAGGKINIHDPRKLLTVDLREDLITYKAEVWEWLERFEERAAIMEFDGGLTRAQAEERAWQTCPP